MRRTEGRFRAGTVAWRRAVAGPLLLVLLLAGATAGRARTVASAAAVDTADARVAAPGDPATRLPLRWEIHAGVDSSAVRQCRRAARAGRARLLSLCWPYVRPPRPVTVHLVTTDTFRRWTARYLPDWGIGVALGGETVVIDAWRADRRERPLGEVLLHELAHSLLEQAAGGVPLPRWFHEGVAQEASGEWRLRDTVSLLLEGVPDLDRVERDFTGPFPAADRAYRAALLAVRYLQERAGPDAVRRVLLATRRAGDFGAGFAVATGQSPAAFARDFGRHFHGRHAWLMLLTSWPGLFVLLAAVLVVGWAGRRWRDRRRLAEMSREEAVRPVSVLWEVTGPRQGDDDEPPTVH